MQNRYFNLPQVHNFAGWLIFFAGLGALALIVPESLFDSSSANFILLIGIVGIWRYSIGIIHFLRGMYFLHWVFPRLRRQADDMGEAAMPPHIYLMVTSFRIDAHTTAEVYKAVLADTSRKVSPLSLAIFAPSS